MDLLVTAVAVLALCLAALGVFKGATKQCWACWQRIGRRAEVCPHCGRDQE